jgi:hypothetical protein
LALAVVSGWVAGVALYALIAAMHWYAPRDSWWEPLLAKIVTAFATVGPGFVAGYLATRSGFLVGASAGVLTSVVNSIFIAQLETRSVMDHAELPTLGLPDDMAFALAAAIVGGICGLAGVKVALDRSQRASS